MVHTLHYKQGKRKRDNLNMFCPYFINPFNKLVFIPWGIVANIFISTELKTLEWWISGLRLFLNLQIKYCLESS